MAVDLTCEFIGIKLKNPFLIASVPSAGSWGLARAAKAGWAGAIHWGAEPLGQRGAFYRGYIPREQDYIGKPPQWWSFENSCGPRDDVNPEQHLSPDRVENIIRRAKESGIVVGCNVFEGANPDAWTEVAQAAERGGADFIELNWSCPYFPESGMEIGTDPELRMSTMKAVRKGCSLPVMVKLNASLGSGMLAEAARGAVEAGADAISITNTMKGFVGVNIETGVPLACELCKDGKVRGMIGGISGPGIKPMGLRGVAEIRRAISVPISAIGGVDQWESAVEYMLMGATTIQVGTAVMLYGYKIVLGMIRGLEAYMERKGYKQITDFVGLTSDRYLVGEYVDPAEKQPRKMVINEEKCTGCGLCLVACQASNESGALRVEDKKARIDHKLCQTCNSCLIVCPEGAITVEWDPGYLK
ncbi:4Fe-4S dicluster-binding protein [Chloroflexota bacterium]